MAHMAHICSARGSASGSVEAMAVPKRVYHWRHGWIPLDPSTGRIGGKVPEANPTLDLGSHRPDEFGAPINNLTSGEYGMPRDVYTHPQFYTHAGGRGRDPVTRRYDLESTLAILQLKGKPDNTPVTVYRAVPRGVTTINPGDWVAISKTYALRHSDGMSDWGSMDVLEAKVPAKHVRNGGNDIIEWGYWGPRRWVAPKP